MLLSDVLPLTFPLELYVCADSGSEDVFCRIVHGAGSIDATSVLGCVSDIAVIIEGLHHGVDACVMC